MNHATTLERRDFLTGHTNPESAASDGFWLHVSRSAMACRFEITLPISASQGVSVAQRALEHVDRLEAQLSIFRSTSEVSRLNRAGAAHPVRVNRSLLSLLKLSRDLFDATNGAFDITSGPLSQVWGFLRRQGRIPDETEIREARSLVGCEKVLLDEAQSTVTFDRPGVMINFGSIGKGYALDRIATSIRRDVTAALISAGSSSMRAIGSGARGQQGWTVGIRHPRDARRRLAVLRLRNTSLSTSGHEEQFFEFEGRRYGHIIDPRTGQPSEGISGMTVIHRSAAVADALATAFHVGGTELARTYCEAHPGTMAIALEASSEEPVIIGENEDCDVEITNE
jgi:FAD:protein FMN transferase